MIHLVGPGGAGKSTVGPLVAELLAHPFHDLDRLFEVRHGDIDSFLDRHGYVAYAHANVEVYQDVEIDDIGVLALSSGFMTYPDGIHPALPSIRRAIAARASTVVLLPSLDVEVCVAETVRRQRARGLPRARSDAREEAVIRARFPVYAALPARQIETMRPAAAVAEEIADLVMSAERRQDSQMAENRPSIIVRWAHAGDVTYSFIATGIPAAVVTSRVADRCIAIGECDGRPVGALQLEYLWGTRPYIAMIRVEPEYQRRGVGRALLAFVEAALRHDGAGALFSSSQADEPEPQAWHRHMGFAECGFIAEVNEAGVGEVFFRKSFAPKSRTSDV